MRFKKILSKQPILMLFINSLIWGMVHEFLINYLPASFEKPSLSNLIQHEKNIFSILKNPVFWSTSAGVSIYIFVEVFIVSSIIFFACKLYKTSLSFAEVIKVVIVAYSIFIVQSISEIIFLNLYQDYFKIVRLENFSLFSISFFLTLGKIHFNSVLNYMLQTISLYEILFWVALSLGLSKILHQQFKRGFKIIASSYIPALIVWLIFISFLTLINS